MVSISPPAPRGRLVAILVLSAIAGLAVLFPVFLGASEPPDDPWLDDLDEARRLAEKTDRFLLVDLYADWCTWCKVLDSRVFATWKFREHTRDRFVLLRVDTEDGAEGTALTERFGIRSLPTTLVLDADLAKVGSIAGFAPLERFLGEIDRVLLEHRAFEDRYRRERKSDDIEVLRRLADELHRRRDGRRAAPLYRQVAAADPSLDVLYLLGDSLRLAGEAEAAAAVVSRALAAADDGVSPGLGQSLEMLRFRVASELGECAEAVTALETLIDRYPRGRLVPDARRELEVYRKEASCS